jgi:hypothetical protein
MHSSREQRRATGGTHQGGWAARCACVRARVPLLTLLYNVYPLLRLHRLLTPTPPPTPTKRTRRRTQRRHRITGCDRG